VSNTVPAIKAFDLNSFQSGINGIINGTYSHKSIVVDGTGGALVTPASGALVVTQAALSNTFPNPTVPRGTIYRDQLFSAVAVVDASGTPYKGINLASVTHTMTGIYQVFFTISLGGFLQLDLPLHVSVISSVSAFAVCETNVGTPTRVTVRTFDGPTGALADFPFCLTILNAP
jgi:hypothetical protein